MSINYALSMQSIKHQVDEKVKDLLLAEIKRVRAIKKIKQKDVTKSKLEKIIFDEMGLNVSLLLDAERFNAYMIMPTVDKNNPLMTEQNRRYGRSDGALKFFKNGNDVLSGSVDIVNSRVSGVFSEINTTVALGSGLFGPSKITDSEVVAILMHELGHLFTYFLVLGDMLTANHSINAALADEDFGVDEKRTKEILFAIDGQLRIHIPDKSKYKSRDESVLAATIADGVIRRQKSEFGTAVFDERGCEVLADQFAARHGLSLALVTGLDKLQRMYGSKVYMAKGLQVLLEVMKVIFFLIQLLGMGNIMMLGIFLNDPTRLVYDPPKSRAKRIRDQVVSALKDRKLSAKRRQKLLEQIKAIDAVMDKMTEHDTFYEYLWKNILPWGKGASLKASNQVELETILNNDLYVQSQRIKNL